MQFNIASPGLRLAIYARVSTEEQREGQTIDSQIAELERFARDKAWQITGIYKDEGWSGAVVARPELDRLRDDAAKGVFQGVLINDVDRLARDVAHLGVLKRDLERQGVQVIFRKLPTETSPMYNLMVNILGSFAEFERELIADRTRRGRRHKVEVRKQFLGSIPPYGFRYIPKDRAAGKEGILEVMPEEATVVRQMFQWVAGECLSGRKVLQRLNDLKIPPRKRNSTWAKSSVLRILHCEVYTGVWHYNKHQSFEPPSQSGPVRYRRHAKSMHRRRPKEDWIPLILPDEMRLVSREQWERVQEQLQRNIVFSKRNGKHLYLLKGLVRCSGCMAQYVGEPCHGRFYYRCAKRCKKIPTVSANILEGAIWQAVENVILNPGVVADGAANQQAARIAATNNTATERDQIAHALEQIEAEESRLLEAYRTEIITPAQLGQELEKIKTRRNTLEIRRAAVNSPQPATPELELRRSIEDYCREAAQSMAGFDDSERQRFLRLLHLEAVFTGNNVRINGRLPVSNPRMLTTGENMAELPAIGRIADPGIGSCARNPSLQKQHETDVVGFHDRYDPQASDDARLASSPTEIQGGFNQAHGITFDLSSHLLPPVWKPMLRDELGRFCKTSAEPGDSQLAA